MQPSPTSTNLRPPRWIAPVFLILGLILSGLLWTYRIDAFTPEQRASLIHYGVAYVNLGAQSTEAIPHVPVSAQQRTYWGFKWKIYNGRDFPALFERCAYVSGVLIFGFLIAGMILQRRARQRWLEPRHVRGKQLLTPRQYNNLKSMRKGADGMYIRLAKQGDD